MAGGGGDGVVVVMPMWKRASITAIQLTMTLITAGVIIGYGQLYQLLVNEGVYHSKCLGSPPLKEVCPQQALALDQLFNIGASVSIFIQAPSGIVLDFLGPRITCWAGLALFIPGCFVFAFAKSIHSFDAYMIGFQLLACGGPFVFISSLPVSQLWPDKKAMILMMVNGVYGGGASVFFLFSLLYNHAGVSMRNLFIGYGIVGGAIVFIALFAWPRRSFAETKKTNNIQSESPAERLSTVEILQKSIKDICTVHYLFLALFVALLVFKSNFFLSTYNNQFGVYMNEQQAAKYNTIFGVVLPAIGVLAGPLGLFFDRFGVNAALFLVIALSTISSLCGMTIYFSTSVFSGLQIVRMIVFSAYYPMIYGVWAFALIARYGTTNFGVLYGVIAVLAGIVNISFSNVLNNFALNPTRHDGYFKANLILVSIGLVFVLYPIVCGIRDTYLRKRKHQGYQKIDN